MMTDAHNLLGVPLETNGLVALGVALVAIFFLFSSYRKRIKRRNAQAANQKSPQREPPSANSKAQLKNDLEALLVELQGLSRKISAEIDTRFAKLEAAMRDADRRIVTLNRLSREQAERSGELPAESLAQDVRHSVVYELADAGHSSVEIAKDLGKTPGEVELILNLRKQVNESKEK